MTLNAHCDWIHGYGGNCVHNVAAITQLEITWKQCFLYLFPLKRDFFFTAVTFSPAEFHVQIFPFETDWCRERHVHVLLQMLLTVTHRPVFQQSLCSSPPFISSLPLVAVLSSFVLCNFANLQNPPCFPPICQHCQQSLRKNNKTKQDLQIWKVSHGAWCTTPRWHSLDESCWNTDGILFCFFVF